MVKNMTDKLFAKFRVGVKAAIPGSILSIELPGLIEMQVQEISNIGNNKHRVELKAINGVGHIIIEGADEEFAKLKTLLDLTTKAEVPP